MSGCLDIAYVQQGPNYTQTVAVGGRVVSRLSDGVLPVLMRGREFAKCILC
jgi:hypothetical protein